MSPDKETIEEIAIELGVHPSFVEKDWYAVKVVQAIAEFSHEWITPIFSGGTSLSKGYGLIKRFSEDLDFRGRYEEGVVGNKPIRRAFREDILKAVGSVESIGVNEIHLEAGSNFFKIPLTYPRQFDVPDALRPDLQLEFSFTQPRQDPTTKTISSFVAEFSESDPETEILCLLPLETAADKLSALIWRVLKRDRGGNSDDPAMIRHLHDLCALKDAIQVDQGVFYETVDSAFLEDMQSGRRDVEKSLRVAAVDAITKLRDDSEYRSEYEQFVAGTSYADEADNIRFEDALVHLESLISALK